MATTRDGGTKKKTKPATAVKTSSKKAGRGAKTSTSKKAAAAKKSAASKKTPAKKKAAKAPVKKTAARTASGAKKSAAKKPAAKKATARKAPAKKSAAKKPAAKKATARKAPAKKAAAKKAPAKKAPAKKAAAKKAPAKKAAAKKAPAKKAEAEKAPAKKSSSGKATPKKSATRKKSTPPPRPASEAKPYRPKARMGPDGVMILSDDKYLLKAFYNGQQMPSPMDGFLMPLGIRSLDDGGAMVLFECSASSLRYQMKIPKATRGERAKVREIQSDGDDPDCPRHGPGQRLYRAGKDLVCTLCGISYGKVQ